MFCNKCGNQMPEGAGFCNKCGAASAAPAPQQPYPGQPVYYQAPPPEPDVPNTGLNALSFFIPIVGFIVYATSNAQTPIKAKACLKMSIIGVCCWVGFSILAGVLSALIPMLMFL